MEIFEAAVMILFVFLVLPKLLPVMAKIMSKIISNDK